MARYIDADKLKMDSDIDNFDMPYGCSFKVIDRQPTADVVEVRKLTPCDLCAYNPPSSFYGKPCTLCPAEKKKGVIK